MKNALRMIITMLMLVICADALEAQTPKWKELQKESDGFQWYKYTYEKNSKGNYPEAAFDLNGKRLTCTTDYTVYYNHGYFEVWVKTDINGRHVSAVYDKQGNCIVPADFGFTVIWIGSDDNTISVSRCDATYNTIEGTEFQFSLDGKYYTEGITGWKNQTAFDANKKPVSSLSPTYIASLTSKPKSNQVSTAPTTTTSSKTTTTSTTSSTTSGSGNDKGLLYKGEYTICRSRQYDELTGNPMGISASDETQVVEIYEDHVYLGVHYCEYQSTNNRGERVYKDNLNKDATLYVSPNFDIRYYWSMTSMYGSCNVVIPVEKGTSYMSGGNGGYSAPQQGGYNGGDSGGNNGGNSGTNTSTPHKTHKCGLCNGTGRVIENNGTSFGKTKYCNECGKTVPDYHYHTTCPSCNGKGYW